MKKILALSLVTLLAYAEEPLNLPSNTETPPSLEAVSEETANLELISLESLGSEETVAISPLEESAHEHMESFFDSEKDVMNIEINEEIVQEEGALAATASLEEPTQETLAREELISESEMQDLEAEVNGLKKDPSEILIDLRAVFAGSPTIYTLLMALSIGSFGIWLYTLFSLRDAELMPRSQIDQIKEKLKNKEHEEALLLCRSHNSLFAKMVSVGLSSKENNTQSLLNLMNNEGKRVTASFWQKISLLNDIAMIAPMIGLLGTVMGMFYAFYDLNRSIESISALFDGLGISVGTTVCGLSVAILAMLFYSMTKYRLVKQLNTVENEVRSVACFIETRELP